MDPFCMRQFSDPNNATFIDFDDKAFTDKVNELYEAQLASKAKGEIVDGRPQGLVDGYAPFCKHVFITNFTPAHTACVPINDQNRHLLVSGYEARRADELPVLTRYFPRSSAAVTPPVATVLDIILYDRDQINKENKAMGKTNNDTAPWGIVSIKPQMVWQELPMTPMTMMRNALGVAEGGSGIPLDRGAYTEAVKFWSGHATMQ